MMMMMLLDDEHISLTKIAISDYLLYNIKNCLFDSTTFSNICKLTDSQYQGVITMTPKSNKDHLLGCNCKLLL